MDLLFSYRKRKRARTQVAAVIYTNPPIDILDQNQHAAEKQLYESETKQVKPSTAQYTTPLSSNERDQNDKDSPLMITSTTNNMMSKVIFERQEEGSSDA